MTQFFAAINNRNVRLLPLMRAYTVFISGEREKSHYPGIHSTPFPSYSVSESKCHCFQQFLFFCPNLLMYSLFETIVRWTRDDQIVQLCRLEPPVWVLCSAILACIGERRGFVIGVWWIASSVSHFIYWRHCMTGSIVLSCFLWDFWQRLLHRGQLLDGPLLLSFKFFVRVSIIMHCRGSHSFSFDSYFFLLFLTVPVFVCLPIWHVDHVMQQTKMVLLNVLLLCLFPHIVVWYPFWLLLLLHLAVSICSESIVGTP